jgi:uncharacterized repeat protein (TIGR03803 family)
MLAPKEDRKMTSQKSEPAARRTRTPSPLGTVLNKELATCAAAASAVKYLTGSGALIALAAILVLPSLAWAGSEQVLYQFKSPQDGQFLLSGVLLLNGKIYGVTYGGGTSGAGTVFELTHNKTGWTKETLYNFTRRKDGGLPVTELAADKAGNLYGTATQGGSYLSGCPVAGGVGCGVVFKLTRRSGHWKLTVIHKFNGKDGSNPAGNLVWDDVGNLYGTSFGGKSCGIECGYGTVFKLSRSGTSWKLSTIHFFRGPDGASPVSLFRDSKGNLYGSTGGGGKYGNGTVYKLSPSGNRWTLTTLYSFTGGADGNGPSQAAVLYTGAAIYGTTVDGGLYSYGYGVVYEVALSNGTWQESVLHTFTGGDDGSYPCGGVTMDSNGNLYGTAQGGEVNGGHGVIFKLTNFGGTWTESTVFDFNVVDGDSPYSDLVWDASGNLYGTTYYGGAECQSQGACGNVFEFTPSADLTTQNAQP